MRNGSLLRLIFRLVLIGGGLVLLFSGGVPAHAEDPLPAGPLPAANPGINPHPLDLEGIDLPEPDPRSLPSVEAGPEIQEFLAPSTSVVINEFHEIYDKVELFNLSDSAVDMTGWELKFYDENSVLADTYAFPSGFMLNPGAYVVVHEWGNPLDNTATNLYAGVDLYMVAYGGALSLEEKLGGTDFWSIDFVRWGVSLAQPPEGSGWAGVNPFYPDFVFFSMGRSAGSLDQDYGEDWSLQNSSLGAQNVETLCVDLMLVTFGNGAAPLYTPASSDGCDPGYFVPGEVITLTADPATGWEVGQWDEKPATDYLGTGLVLEYTMTVAHEVLTLSYIQSDPPSGSVLLMGLWSNYQEVVDAYGLPYDRLNGYSFAPDWEVLDRYDLVVYQTIDGPFVPNMRATSFATYLDEGGCMWVEADSYQAPAEGVPDVLYAYFGIGAEGSLVVPGTLTGTGTIFSGLGPYTDSSGEDYITLTPENGAESAFEDGSANVFGVDKLTDDYLTSFVSFDFNSLLPGDREEMFGTMIESCIPLNDDFDDAFEVSSLPYTSTQHTMAIRHATTAADDPLIWFGQQRDYTVWYRFTAAATEGVQVDTLASTPENDYDTVLAVWTGTRGNLTKVSANDDDTGVVQSELQFMATAGTTYYIEVAGYDMFSYGTLELNIVGGVTMTCYTLNVFSSSGGADPVPSPTSSPGCAPGKYIQGEPITFTAAPEPGYVVNGWYGTSNDASTSTENTAIMPGGILNVGVSYVEAAATLFEADFEEGDLLEWTRYNDGDGWLYVCDEAAMNGAWGACIERGDNDKRKQLIDETPVDQTSFNARFNFDINSLSMGEGERFRFVQVKMGAERPFFIVLKSQGGQYYLQLNTLLDDLSKTKTGWYLLSDAPHTIEIAWQAASGDGANDGYCDLYLDDSLLESLSGLDNDTLVIENFKIGFTSKLVGKTISGIFYVDDVATSNSGMIGLP